MSPFQHFAHLTSNRDILEALRSLDSPDKESGARNAANFVRHSGSMPLPLIDTILTAAILKFADEEKASRNDTEYLRRVLFVNSESDNGRAFRLAEDMYGRGPLGQIIVNMIEDLDDGHRPSLRAAIAELRRRVTV